MQFRNVLGMAVLASLLVACNDDGETSLADAAYTGERGDASLSAANADLFPRSAFAVREFSFAGSSLAVDRCQSGSQQVDNSAIDATSHTGKRVTTYSQCLANGVLLDGTVETLVYTYDKPSKQPLSLNVIFHGLQIGQSGKTVTLTGNLESTQDIVAKVVNLQMDMHMAATTGEQVLASLHSEVKGQRADRSADSTLEGSVCVGSAGCSSLQTVTPFSVDYHGLMTAGELLTVGGKSKVKMLAKANNRVAFRVDADGNGVYD